MKRFGMKMPDEVAVALSLIAKHHGLSRSAVIYMLVKQESRRIMNEMGGDYDSPH